MTPATLHSLFDRLFGGTDGAGRIDARHAAELAAGMEHGEPTNVELDDDPERSTALLAAYLDGDLDDAVQQEVHMRLSQSPALLHEVASADAFLDAMASARVAAPAELVATIIARTRPATVLTPPQGRSFAIWKWSGMAVALAVAVFAVLVFIGRQSVPTDTSVPVAVKSVPGADWGEIAPPLVTKRRTSPKVDPKTMEVAPPLEPAGDAATLPLSRARNPAFAPEGMDIMPRDSVSHH